MLIVLQKRPDEEAPQDSLPCYGINFQPISYSNDY